MSEGIWQPDTGDSDSNSYLLQPGACMDEIVKEHCIPAFQAQLFGVHQGALYVLAGSSAPS